MSSHPIHEANKISPYGDLAREEFHKNHQILHKESYMLNKQNMKIFTQSWQPADSTSKVLKGLVAMIHGYCSESSWLFELNAVAIAKAGYFVCALDLQGHGYSEGSPGIISDFEYLVSDSIQYFDSVRKEHPRLPAFLYGESMGGAFSIIICLRQKNAWNGLILCGPLCGVSRNLMPLWPMEKVVIPVVASIAPLRRINSTNPLATQSIKEVWKKKLAGKSPNPPTKAMLPLQAITAREYIKVCVYVQERCRELDLPLLVLHGGDDRVCDPQFAKFLHDSAASQDKSLKIFPGMWHRLFGEPNESVELVFEMIVCWIELRAKMVKMNSTIMRSSL
ncbi:OLC1v1031712C1 [Oldenlandia corymbosa var. corymbosa]|uniref:OLC1v1031712C1 n=1 Tax=Oldenlandia corymbosa var. corymbosa TaxID=529605 RepID=A0AAV1CK44_OLDCO|nr:OLC1v1031712C1 [Oldenlandia corymbosa var. corymbosa]